MKRIVHVGRVRRALPIALIVAVSCANASTLTTTTPTPTASASVELEIVAMGQSVTTRAGNRVTVFSYESSVGGSRVAPSGQRFVAADVEACAGAHAAPGTAVSRSQFALETPDRTGWASVDPIKTPALQNATLKPAECKRGWITFLLPSDQKPKYVVLVSSNIVKWQVT